MPADPGVYCTILPADVLANPSANCAGVYTVTITHPFTVGGGSNTVARGDIGYTEVYSVSGAAGNSGVI